MTSTLPSFSLMCLATAEETTTVNAFRGKNVVIDFWTTKCTRCPAALDKLDTMSRQVEYSNVVFASICCDQLDGAREIIEKKDERRWQGMSHYFMNLKDKEEAKRIFGFKSVPFYVFVDESGKVTQFGSSKTINLEDIPGSRNAKEDKENIQQNTDAPEPTKSQPLEQAFVIDDLDF